MIPGCPSSPIRNIANQAFVKSETKPRDGETPNEECERSISTERRCLSLDHDVAWELGGGAHAREMEDGPEQTHGAGDHIVSEVGSETDAVECFVPGGPLQPPTRRTRASRLGRVVRQRRRKAAEIHRQAQAALRQFLQIDAKSLSTETTTIESPPEESDEIASTTHRPARGSRMEGDDRTRARPAVTELRTQHHERSTRDAGGMISDWDGRVEFLLASQLGYVPGNAVRVSCYQSHVPCLNRRAPEIENGNVVCAPVIDDSGPHPSGRLDVPVAIELYPLAVRDDTTARTTKASRARHGKPRRRKVHNTTSSEPIAEVSGETDMGGSSCCDDDANRHNRNGCNEVLEPFPTLYWVTHPLLRVLISQLEVEGWVRRFEEGLRSDPEAQRSMLRAHAKYGAYRESLLSPDDRQLLKERNWESALCPETRGVAGIRYSGTDPASMLPRGCAVKCLHAHVAHYLSALCTVAEGGFGGGGGGDCDTSTSTSVARDNGGNDNVVGLWVMELIQHRLSSEVVRSDGLLEAFVEGADGNDEPTGRH